jgi:hypothetical protein
MDNSANDFIEVTDAHLPALFAAADLASVTAQRKYTRWILADLTLLVVGSLLSSFHRVENSRWVVVLSAIAVGLSLIISFVIRSLQLERGWYGGRAAAESVKSLAWRYMICAEPYVRALSSPEADRKFTADLSSILEQRKYLALEFTGDLSNKAQITERMREIREFDVENRKKAYLSQRIANQRTWYMDKSVRNQKRIKLGFTAILLSQTLALISAFVLVAWPDSPVNWTSPFAAFAAAFLAWVQVKQYQELAQAYAVAAHELGLIIEQARYVKTEDALSSFVADAENAISREHTLWVARRDKT